MVRGHPSFLAQCATFARELSPIWRPIFTGVEFWRPCSTNHHRPSGLPLRRPEAKRHNRVERYCAMSKPTPQKIVPHLWYVREAEEAARFYASVFPDSRVNRVTAMPAESPSGPAGSVVVVEFTLCGQPF